MDIHKTCTPQRKEQWEENECERSKASYSLSRSLYRHKPPIHTLHSTCILHVTHKNGACSNMIYSRTSHNFAPVYNLLILNISIFFPINIHFMTKHNLLLLLNIIKAVFKVGVCGLLNPLGKIKWMSVEHCNFWQSLWFVNELDI